MLNRQRGRTIKNLSKDMADLFKVNQTVSFTIAGRSMATKMHRYEELQAAAKKKQKDAGEMPFAQYKDALKVSHVPPCSE